jgi:hypothetical protein
MVRADNGNKIFNEMFVVALRCALCNKKEALKILKFETGSNVSKLTAGAIIPVTTNLPVFVRVWFYVPSINYSFCARCVSCKATSMCA